MSKQALFQVTVAGTNITTALMPVLISLSVSDKAGTHSDTANLKIDDTNGQIILPKKGAPVVVALGWKGEGMRVVFTGTVDEVKSSGSRGSGRILDISAKGFDTTAKPKEQQQRHWDDTPVEDILKDAGEHAGVTEIDIDADLAKIRPEYFEMRDESFVAAGERIARETGGNFRVSGKRATLSKRNGSYPATVIAAWGSNLHSWSISPQLGRPQFKKTKARYYDMAKADTLEASQDTPLDADAEWEARHLEADEPAAKRRAKSDAATSERDAGGGSVTIEGNTSAIPDGLCIVQGTRPGVDGAYSIETVNHSYSRSGGFTTSLELKHPQQGAGTDAR